MLFQPRFLAAQWPILPPRRGQRPRKRCLSVVLVKFLHSRRLLLTAHAFHQAFSVWLVGSQCFRIFFPLEMVIFHDCPVFEGAKTTNQPTNQPSIASVNDSLTQHVAHWWQMATVWLHVPPCIGVVCGPPPSQWKKWFPMVWVNECKWSMMLPSIIHSTFLRKATTPLQKQKQAGKYRYQKRKKHISHHLSNYLLNYPCLMVLKC